MQCASGVLGWEIKDPGKKAVAKMQARNKKEVKYGYKNGNKNEGLRDCPNRTCHSEVLGSWCRINRNGDVRRNTVGGKVILNDRHVESEVSSRLCRGRASKRLSMRV